MFFDIDCLQDSFPCLLQFCCYWCVKDLLDSCINRKPLPVICADAPHSLTFQPADYIRVLCKLLKCRLTYFNKLEHVYFSIATRAIVSTGLVYSFLQAWPLWGVSHTFSKPLLRAFFLPTMSSAYNSTNRCPMRLPSSLSKSLPISMATQI